MSERTRYDTSRCPPGSTLSSTKRGRGPSTYGTRSSSISSPVGSRETLSIRRCTRASERTVTRAGASLREPATR
jgi:hypothetical protein